MAQWTITKEGPSCIFETVDQVYDDSNGDVNEFMDSLKQQDSICRAASLIPNT
jgi:hypothetical protein